MNGRLKRKAAYLKCASAVLDRENDGYYPELDWDSFAVFNDFMGGEAHFAAQEKELLSLMLCFMAAMQ